MNKYIVFLFSIFLYISNNLLTLRMSKVRLLVSLLTMPLLYGMEEKESEPIVAETSIQRQPTLNVPIIWKLLHKGNGAPNLKFIAAFQYVNESKEAINELNIPKELKAYVLQVKDDIHKLTLKNSQELFSIADRFMFFQRDTDRFMLFQRDKERAILLINSGAINLGLKDSSGETALFHAARHNYIDLAKLLIIRGTDINHQDNERRTVLIITAACGHIDIAKLLINYGADINLKNCRGQTCLMVAAELGHIDMAKLLIDHGADINLKNIIGQAALLYAAINGHTNMVKMLIDRGCNLHIKNGFGSTALMLAVSNGHSDIVQLLIEARVDLNAQDANDQTALDIAREYGNAKIVKLLEEAQAKQS